jgi:hypothetical protein
MSGSWFPRWLAISGAFAAFLGIAHLTSAPEVMRRVPPDIPEEGRKVFLFMFLAAGASVVLAGALMIWASAAIARRWRGFWTLGLVTGLYLAGLGAGAAMFMPSNAFAYLALAAGLSALPPLFLLRRAWRGQGEVLDFLPDKPRDKRTIH